MGTQSISRFGDDENLRHFEHALLSDILALESMLKLGLIESGIRRIGAEQELFLVDQNLRPAMISSEVLRLIHDPRITLELARFNLEANMTARMLHSDCLRNLETELNDLCQLVRSACRSLGADIVMTGILPTLTLSDLSPESLSDSPRYHQLERILAELRGDPFHIHIKGLDEIQIVHESMILEACNTSFQLHYQCDPDTFANSYNVAQLITAPLLAAAVNSPMLFHKRLWSETRVALFQHSVDDRSRAHQARYRPPRVTFGDRWVRESVLELFREDVARFRILMTVATDPNPMEVLSEGKIPQLAALRIHNGTVWRWNRPCYGILDGRPHLRIENRVLPAGPTIVDEMANAAFFYGLMVSMEKELPPVSTLLDFDSAKENFFAAARHGLKAQFTWFKNRNIPATDLILQELLPLAHLGLQQAELNCEDIARYLGIFEERVRSGQTGAAWIVKSYSELPAQGPEYRARTITQSILEKQASGEPVHCWTSPSASFQDLLQNYSTVERFMSTDLFTVRPHDVVDLAASIMDWERIRHVPVEDDHGNLAGIVSHRDLLHLLATGALTNNVRVPVHDVMKQNPITVTPETPTLEAIDLMRKNGIGCLPVVRDNRLVGIITVYDLLALSSRLLEKALREINH